MEVGGGVRLSAGGEAKDEGGRAEVSRRCTPPWTSTSRSKVRLKVKNNGRGQDQRQAGLGLAQARRSGTNNCCQNEAWR